jgi:hypothetical protein
MARWLQYRWQAVVGSGLVGRMSILEAISVPAGVPLRGRMAVRPPRGAVPDIARLVGAAGWARLAPDIRRRFAPGHAHAAPVYRGRLEMACSPAGFVFALLSRLLGAPLPALRAASMPAEVHVRESAAGGVVWERRLGAGLCVRSTKRCDPDGGLVEQTDGGIGMHLAVFEEAGALVFESRGYFLDFGRGWRLKVPALLTPGRCRVSHAPEGPDASRFRFTMSMVHPIWGRTFHQTGIFEDPADEECAP